jgi:hypothetical protein
MYKLLIIFFLTLSITAGLEIIPECVELAKNVLCIHFFDLHDREECVKNIEPVYKWVFQIIFHLSNI